MTNSEPTAPPALKTPLAVEMTGVVMEAYPGSPFAGRLKYAYQPGCPIVLPMIDAQ
jgi:hypothetical protein